LIGMSEERPELETEETGIVRRLSRAAALCGGCIVLAAGGLIVVSVCTRWMFFVSVPGDVELIQTATAVAAFAFLPFGQITRSTLVVDTFTKLLSVRACQGIDAFWDLLYALFALILSWRLAIGAFDALRSHTVTTVLALPIGWFMAASTMLLLLLSATAFVSVGRLLPSRT
jgi:TRAP-type C4-dicarboxylate transport system permease small subunit